MRPSIRTGLATLTVVVLSACSGTEADTRLTAQRDTVDGVPRLLYPATGTAPLGWRLDTLAVIGEVFGDDPDYQFDNVTSNGVTGDAAGNVWLLDGAGSRMIGYAPDGTFIESFGGRGSGPGEISAAAGVTTGHGDTLWVVEIMGGRLTGFPVVGGEPRVITFDANRTAATPIVVREDGILAGMRSVFGLDGMPDGERRAVIARFAHDGALRDTVYSMLLPEADVARVQSGERRMVMMSTPLFSPALHWAAFSDGALAVVDDDRYSISLVDPDGSERFRIERDAPPRATTEADRQAALEAMRNRRFGGVGLDRATLDQMVRQQIEATTFAPTVPRIDGLATDEQDRLWVLASPDEPGGEPRIDLYDRDGLLLGSLFGIGIPAAFLRNGLAAYLGKDEDTDVQQVTIVRLLDG